MSRCPRRGGQLNEVWERWEEGDVWEELEGTEKKMGGRWVSLSMKSEPSSLNIGECAPVNLSFMT